MVFTSLNLGENIKPTFKLPVKLRAYLHILLVTSGVGIMLLTPMTSPAYPAPTTHNTYYRKPLKQSLTCFTVKYTFLMSFYIEIHLFFSPWTEVDLDVN